MPRLSKRSQEDFDAEIHSHIEIEADRLVDEGMDRESALGQARRTFGNITRTRESFYESSHWMWLENLSRDVRFALRQLAARPGFTLTATLTLAAGIAASTAIFSVVYGVLLAPLPYAEADRLVQARLVNPENGDLMEYMTGMDFLDLRDNVSAIESIACSYNYRETGFNLDLPDGAARVRSLSVSSQFFDVYGVQPALGRTFTEQDGIGGEALAILSHDLWRSRFGSDQAVIGQIVRADGVGYKVVGVMQQGFQDAHVADVDLWIPHNTTPGGRNHRDNYYITAVARLAPGATVAEAQREIDAVRERLRSEESLQSPWDPQILPLAEEVADGSRALLYALLAGAGLLLLASCINLGVMLLVRGRQRQRELAVRAALGSSRMRLVRQLLTESVVLAALGGLVGMGLGMMAVDGLTALAAEALPRVESIRFDWRICLAGVIVTALTALLFGYIPSLKASRVDIETALRESTRGGSAGVGQHRLHQGLIVLQIAVAVVILIGAGLLTKSFGALLQSDLGFNPTNVLVYEISPPDSTYPEGADRASLYRRLQGRIAALPGVAATGATSWLPAKGQFNTWGYTASGGAQRNMNADIRVVQGDYFDAMRIRLREGTLFEPTDGAESRPVVVVSESLAAFHWPDSSAIGETISIADAERTIVGVVRDTRFNHRVAAARKIYVPHEQFADNRNWALHQVVRTAFSPSRLRSAIESEVAAIDSGLVIHHVRLLEDVVADAIARERFAMALMSAFGWTALLLSIVGIYGVLSYIVAQRTREIGIRVALGASKREILRNVMGRAMRLALQGALAGALVAAFGTRWLESLLYSIEPTDLSVFAAVAGLTVAAAMVACVAPAFRAVNVNPVRALRQD